MMGSSNHQGERYSTITSALLGLAVLVCLISTTSCSTAPVLQEAPPPPPEWTTGMQDAAAPYANHDDREDQNRTSIIFNDGYVQEPLAPRPRWMSNALRLLAKEMMNYQRRALVDPFEHYRNDIRKFQDNYDVAEEFALTQGIDKESFRQGIAMTTGAVASSLSILYLSNPRRLSRFILGTHFRVGYDVSQLDDPKFYLLYGERGRFGVNRNGLIASYVDKSGRSYAGDLNVLRMRATMKVMF